MSTSTIPDLISEPSRRAATPPPVAVLVVESDGWLASRLCDLMQTEPGFRLAAAAAGAEEAMSMANREQFDIAVIGHRPPTESAFRLCRELKRMPEPPAVVICCARPDGVHAACCAVATADALVSTYDCDAELVGVLDRVARGLRFLPAVPPRTGAMLRDCLAPAEYALVGMLLAEFPAADIASALRISGAELESHQAALLGKLETLPATPEACS
jgi:two-component system, NarL family, response regulator DevR